MSMNKRKTMFEKTKHTELGKIVEMDTPANARKSAAKLKQKFRNLQHRDAKLDVKRATVLAANRAEAMLNKKNLSNEERIEFRKIKTIYRQAARQMKL